MEETKIQIDDKRAVGFIEEAIKEQIKREIDIEFEKAEKRIKERRAEIIAGVLLRVTKMYSMNTMGETIIFSVKEDNKI